MLNESETPAARRCFACWLTVAFVLLTAPRLLAHELWRNEAWQWLVVAESHSLSELFTGMSRGGGTGYLAPILYFLARQVSTSPLAMQAAHLVMGAAAAFTFLHWAPLGRRERALFALGYFPFFRVRRDQPLLCLGRYCSGWPVPARVADAPRWRPAPRSACSVKPLFTGSSWPSP